MDTHNEQYGCHCFDLSLTPGQKDMGCWLILAGAFEELMFRIIMKLELVN